MSDNTKLVPTQKSWKKNFRNIFITLLLFWLGWISFRYWQNRKIDQALALPVSLGLAASPEDLMPALAGFNSERRDNLSTLLRKDAFAWELFATKDNQSLPPDPEKEHHEKLVRQARQIQASTNWRTAALTELRAGAPFPSSLREKTTAKQLEKYHRPDFWISTVVYPHREPLKSMVQVWANLIALGDDEAWEALTLLTRHPEPPGGLLDFLLYRNLVTIRSRAALRAVLASTPGWTSKDSAPLKAWLEEPSMTHRYFLLAMTAERIFTLTPEAKHFRRASMYEIMNILTSISSACGEDDLFRNPWLFVKDFSVALDAHIRVEFRLANPNFSRETTQFSDILPVGCNSKLHVFFEDYSFIMQKLLQEHALKLATRICILGQQTGGIPETQAGLVAALGETVLETEPGYPLISYEYIGPGKFSVHPDFHMTPTWVFPHGFPKSSYDERKSSAPYYFQGDTLIVDIAAARSKFSLEVALIREEIKRLSEQVPDTVVPTPNK